MMKIGLDVMGGDFAPKTTIDGAVLALDEVGDEVRIVLFGPKQLILDELAARSVAHDRFDIVDAPEVIDMKDKPIKGFQNKPKSSMALGFALLKENAIQAFASAGNSGAFLVGAIYSVNTIQGVYRPATATCIPKETGGYNLLLDIGTNPDAKPDVLYQFGLLGSLFATSLWNIESPKVCLLNIGSEEGKGNLQVQAAYQMMKDTNEYNFVGNLEIRELFKDSAANVFVCDGFIGNMVIKQTEALYRLMAKHQLTDEFFARLNYETYGGSPILGVNAPVVLGHGISSAVAIKNMILQCQQMCESQIIEKMRKAFANNAEKTNSND